MIVEEWMRLNAEACLKKDLMYIDPETGYSVMTSYALLMQEECCGNGCRHCPYPPDEQKRADRPDVPAYPFLDF